MTPISAVMRLLGCSPYAFDEGAPSESPVRSAPRQYNVTVADLIAALAVDERVSSTQASAQATAVVSSDGGLTIDGRGFATPSATRSHVRGGKATNGWAFWAVERDGTTVPLATVRARYLRRTQPQKVEGP
ncbi:hypothetical protein [Egicoccus sp. AB-alg2]|uniref:restriction system modified-DNA reader domain-containing protein n=1 Tax=Egicoccus sp. AB-alg2 TaxID=3242693 RepID=UPI00359EF46D